MLTPTDSTVDSANTTPTPYSDVGEKSIKTPRRKKVSWSGAIKLFRRKTRYTLPLVGASFEQLALAVCEQIHAPRKLSYELALNMNEVEVHPQPP